MDNNIKKCLEISNKYRQQKLNELLEKNRQLYFENLGFFGKILLRSKRMEFELIQAELENKYIIKQLDNDYKFNNFQTMWQSIGLFKDSLIIKKNIYFDYGFDKETMALCLLDWYEVFLGPNNEVYKYYVDEEKKMNESKKMAAAKGIHLNFQPLHELLLEKKNLEI